MPIFNKLPFQRREPDPNIKDYAQVWYIESTNEVFTSYDEFFDRYIQMNSMCWTCAVTGKTGLTFDEARESEEDARKTQVGHINEQKLKSEEKKAISEKLKIDEEKAISEKLKIDETNAKKCYIDALDALKKMEKSKYEHAILAARKLPNDAIDTVDSKFFKIAVHGANEYDPLYPKFCEMFYQFSKGLYEDSSLESAAFPDLKPALMDSTNANLFGNCLAISDFFNSFSTFLDTELQFSGEDLLKAVNSGIAGYYKLTSHVLFAFINGFSLLGFFKNISLLTSEIENVPWPPSASSEICKLLLLRKVTPLSIVLRNSNGGNLYKNFKQNDHEIDEKAKKFDISLNYELAQAFLDKDFYELNPSQQIQLIEHLINLLMSLDSFNKQFTFKEEVLNESRHEGKKAKLHELLQTNADLKAKGKKNDVQNNEKIHQLENAIFEEDQRNRELAKLHAALKPPALILGYDRFHRRYYLFPNSLNHGIFVEEFCQMTSNNLSSDAEIYDPFAVVLEKLTIESARIPLQESLWYRISSMEEFEAIRQILNKKGIRESVLLEAFEKHNDQIKDVLDESQQRLEVMDFDDGHNTEVDYLKEELVQVIKKAESYSFFHFTTTVEEILKGIDEAKTFDELRNESISTSIPAILPCAYFPKISGQRFFHIQSWLLFAELCQSVTQMHALLSILKIQIRNDKLFGIKCPRCNIRLDAPPINKVIACVMCYGYIHLKCHDAQTEVDPDPMKPFWICENCKNLPKKLPEMIGNAKEMEPKKFLNRRVLRSTRARKAEEYADDSSSQTPSLSSSSSRFSPGPPIYTLRSSKQTKD